ncbi:MAG: hypothetical protein E7418_05520 [Ruminococcaceae bacterium]|nr:hypothetical protein [Oscillospiraceae bacterium]
MFGYIRIDKDELKIKEYNLFKSYYCGLCQTLKKEYGFPARYFLSYDVTFLAVLLSALQDDAESEVCSGRCLANPFITRPIMKRNEILRYAAGVNVLLAWFKLRDDWHDRRSLRALLVMPFMYGKQKKSKKRFPALYEHIKASLSSLSVLEKNKTAEIDLPASAFGKLMTYIFDTPLCGSAENRRILAHSGYLLGRLIYILDAWEDREQDQKNGSYNPFLLQEMKQEDVKLMLDYTLGELANGLQLLSFTCNQEIIENIVYLGLARAVDAVLSGQCRKKEKQHERPI